MPQTSSIFAASRIASLTNQFLNRDRLRRMLDAERPEDALKVLYEVSYADGMTVPSPHDYELLLDRDAELTDRFIRQITPNQAVTDCFFIRSDYHNAKVFAKQKYGKMPEGDAPIERGGTLDADSLKTCIFTDAYAFLPDRLAEALKKLDNAALSGSATPTVIDLTLDTAMQEELAGRLKKVRNPLVLQYFRAEADLANLAAVVRLRRLNYPEGELERYLMPGGELATGELKALYNLSPEAFVEHFRYTKYKDFAAGLAVSVTSYEKLRDDFLLGLFRARRNDCFSIDPVVGYYLGKGTERKNIRIIMTALLNSMDRGVAEQRLREPYV